MDLTPEKIVALCGEALAYGRLDKAEALARACLEAGYEDADLRGVIGAVHLERGAYRDAILEYTLSIKWGGATPERLYCLGLVHQGNGDLEKAASLWAQAVHLSPDNLDAAVNGVQAALQLHQWQQVVDLCGMALTAHPDEPRLYLWQGHAYAKLHQGMESTVAYARAADLMPEDVAPRFLQGLGLRDLRRFADAKAALRQVLTIDPDHAEARFELAQLELMDENWEAGFPLWESRLQRKLDLMPDDLPQRAWRGECAPDLTLLIQAEQGFGDTLQFMRFVHLAAKRVHSVVLRVHTQLVSLLRLAFPQYRVVPFSEAVEADAYVPLLSLPYVLGCHDPLREDAVFLSSIIGVTQHRVKTVGVVWSGNPTHHNDWRRSSSITAFAALQNVPDVRFVHFQMDVSDADTACWPGLERGVDTGADFLHTARRVAGCDLVIGVDTALVHLSAALGRTTWVVVPHVPDWRWGENGETSPWYDTVRVWRQSSPGDWDEVMARIVDALQCMETVK